MRGLWCVLVPPFGTKMGVFALAMNDLNFNGKDPDRTGSGPGGLRQEEKSHPSSRDKEGERSPPRQPPDAIAIKRQGKGEAPAAPLSAGLRNASHVKDISVSAAGIVPLLRWRSHERSRGLQRHRRVRLLPDSKKRKGSDNV